jgi:hypothetical protein
VILSALLSRTRLKPNTFYQKLERNRVLEWLAGISIIIITRALRQVLKVPKREIFDRSDFPNFYTIKSSWVGDLLVKILTYYFIF